MNKVLLICLFLYSMSINAQVRRVDLPKILNDSVYFSFDVYTQTINQEAQQQAREFGLKRKVKKLQDIIHEKKRIEPIIDSLFYEIEKYDLKIDSLNKVIQNGSRSIIVDCVYEKEKFIAQKKNLQTQLISTRRKLKRTKKTLKYCIITLFIETGLILLL